MSTFDPNGVGIANGNIFGFPYTEAEADFILIPVPWDATASYGKGTSNGPQTILEASTQLDFYHPDLERAYETKIYMSPVSSEWKAINDRLCEAGMQYIAQIEISGEAEAQRLYGTTLKEINEAHNALRANLKERCLQLLQAGKMPCVLGGEHSTPLGLLHTQVGIRDVSEREIELAHKDPRIHSFYDWQLKNEQYKGRTWAEQVQQIIATLPQKVYISFDIDGLLPSLCPNTGTPVAGGFELQQIAYLLIELVHSGRQIIGFDLNEVAPGPDGDWDANVGARALWHLVCATELSRRKNA